jgi:uncharacterized cupin superfamily protein
MSTPTTATPLLLAVPDAALDEPLEDWGPRVGADSGEPMTSGRIFFESADGAVQVGLWACTPGGWTITDRPDTETVRILAGRARLTDAGGAAVELSAGDVLVLPKGWSGRWDILEPVRKLFVTAR